MNTPIEHIDRLGAALRAMEQRMPAVRFERGDLWAADKRVCDKLRKLETAVHMMRTPCGDVSLRFADGSTGRGATIWEALG